MKIEFNKVTWYSKLITIIVFICTCVIAFYLGKEFGTITEVEYWTPGTPGEVWSFLQSLALIITAGFIMWYTR